MYTRSFYQQRQFYFFLSDSDLGALEAAGVLAVSLHFCDCRSPQESGPKKAEHAGMISHSSCLSTDGLLSISQEAIHSLADDTTEYVQFHIWRAEMTCGVEG